MLTKIIDFEIEQMEIEHSSCFGGVCPMTKTASENELDKINQKKDHAYLHVIAMGAGDFYGENNNGDFFYEKDLKEYYKTFESAGIFVQHFNKDPSKSIGTIVKAIYNDDMHRVELILEIKKSKALDIYNDIKNGNRIKVSMGVKVPQEMCSFCGSITKGSLANRCDHLKFEMHQQKENGQVVYAINIPPMNFFDISVVRKPADTQGHALFQKVASDESEDFGDKVAELVKRMGVMDSMPSPVTVNEMDTFRKSFSPQDIVKIVLSKHLMLKPSEALFIGSNMPKHEYAECDRTCNTEEFVHILKDKLDKSPHCDMVKSASLNDYTNPFIEKLMARSTLVKEASFTPKKDFFGNSEVARTADSARKAFNKHDFAQYKVNYVDGKSVTIPNDSLSLGGNISEYYLDLVDEGFAHSITGLRANGDEAMAYSGRK